MFRTSDDFATAWRHEAISTARVLDRLTDDTLGWRAHPDQRSLGELAWHMVASVHEILGKAGIDVTGPSKRDPCPATASEVRRAYQQAADRVPGAVAAVWEDDLDAKLDFYGSITRRGEVLAILLRHEIHHRGQLTAQLRPAGLTVPGVYGPSADD